MYVNVKAQSTGFVRNEFTIGGTFSFLITLFGHGYGFFTV